MALCVLFELIDSQVCADKFLSACDICLVELDSCRVGCIADSQNSFVVLCCLNDTAVFADIIERRLSCCASYLAVLDSELNSAYRDLICSAVFVYDVKSFTALLRSCLDENIIAVLKCKCKLCAYLGYPRIVCILDLYELTVFVHLIDSQCCICKFFLACDVGLVEMYING